MAKKRKQRNATPGPSEVPSKASPRVEHMDVDPPVATSTSRVFPDDALRFIESSLRRLSSSWKDDGSDIVSDCLHLTSIYTVVQISMPKLPDSLVDLEQFEKNVAKKRESFANVLRMALKGKGLKLWHPVVTHGTSP